MNTIDKGTSVIELLATSLGKKNDKANQDLAVEIIRANHIEWVKELVDNLQNKDKNIQSDCIKTLYEIGERGGAALIAPYYTIFGSLLKSKNNRLVWGAMIALDSITTSKPNAIFDLLSLIIRVTESGSVIAKDHGVNILAKLSSFSDYAPVTFPLLLEQLRKCPAKQLPLYAERSSIAISPANKNQFIEIIRSRFPEMEKESQRQRLNKVLKNTDNK